MRLLPSSVALVIACGPAHVFHKDPERGCADATLAGQEDVAAIAGCSAIGSITIRTGMALDLKPLARLETIRGDLVVGPSVGLSELALPRLRTVSAIKLVGNGDLHGIFLPKLERAKAIDIANNNVLTTISMPVLAAIDGKLDITSNPALEALNLAVLDKADFTVANNPKLTLIDTRLPGLEVAVPAAPSDPPPM